MEEHTKKTIQLKYNIIPLREGHKLKGFGSKGQPKKERDSILFALALKQANAKLMAAHLTYLLARGLTFRNL